jgi:thiol-disulfide isomerase/thioredoxin
MNKFQFTPKQTKLLEGLAWGLAIILLLFTCCYYTFFDKTPDMEVAKVGEVCPEFTVTTYAETENGYQGEQGYFSPSMHRGKVVVINFWATWCGPCVEEIPHFNELYKKYLGDVEMIAINSELSEPDVSVFLTARWSGYALPFGQDNEKSLAWPTLSETETLPVTLILDEQGIIRERIYNSFKNAEELETLIQKYLND